MIRCRLTTALVGAALATVWPGLLTGQEPAADSTPRIAAVELVRRDIFDPAETGVWYARLANALHITTRPSVIRRELLFERGELFDSARVAETARNLRRLGIFRRVQVDSVHTDSGLVLRVLTKDGWSTKPDVRFRSVGGEVAFTLAFIEDNVLGTATKASLRYRKDPDRSTVGVEFRRARLVAGRVGVGLRYEDRSDGARYRAEVVQPFFALRSTTGFALEAEQRDERVLRYRDGREQPELRLRRKFALGRFTFARALSAGDRGYLRLGLSAQIRRDDFAADSLGPPTSRTVTGAVGPTLEWRRARFLVTDGFFSFAREEDVDLSTAVRLRLLAAPAALGYPRDGLAPTLAVHTGRRLPAGFVYLDLLANGLYTAAGLDSGSVFVGGTLALQPGNRHLALLHVEGGWQRAATPGEEFDLGLDAGPRAFRSHAFSGDRMVFATAEYRWTAAPELWGLVGVGLAAFVDHGGAWYAGSPRRLGWDAGLGLRLAASRAADGETIRVDLARRFARGLDPGEWVLVIGKGFLFSLTPG